MTSSQSGPVSTRSNDRVPGSTPRPAPAPRPSVWKAWAEVRPAVLKGPGSVRWIPLARGKQSPRPWTGEAVAWAFGSSGAMTWRPGPSLLLIPSRTCLAQAPSETRPGPPITQVSVIRGRPASCTCELRLRQASSCHVTCLVQGLGRAMPPQALIPPRGTRAFPAPCAPHGQLPVFLEKMKSCQATFHTLSFSRSPCSAQEPLQPGDTQKEGGCGRDFIIRDRRGTLDIDHLLQILCFCGAVPSSHPLL